MPLVAHEGKRTASTGAPAAEGDGSGSWEMTATPRPATGQPGVAGQGVVAGSGEWPPDTSPEMHQSAPLRVTVNSSGRVAWRDPTATVIEVLTS